MNYVNFFSGLKQSLMSVYVHNIKRHCCTNKFSISH